MSEPLLESNIDVGRTLLIWDKDGPPPDGDWITILWSSFEGSSDTNIISIPALVEEQADALRTRYLAWIYELGETLINGKRLIDHLELRPGFSYWWMTALPEKFNISGSSQINNAIKALVFEKIVSVYKPQSIVLVSDNEKIALTIQIFCECNKLDFRWEECKSSAKPMSLARLFYLNLPWPLQSIISLSKYLIRRLPFLFKKKKISPTFNDSEMTFIDVLVHLDTDAIKSGEFISNYWTYLVDVLKQQNLRTNWLHNYFYQQSIPTLTRAQDLVECFNDRSCNFQTHVIIDANLSLTVLLRALKDYVHLYWVNIKILQLRRYFQLYGSALNLWPLFRDEWLDSLIGAKAIHQCLRLSLIEETFKSIPRQKVGVYIQENQPWELALIYTWKKSGHGRLIGVPHTTVRYWDLRYFYDSRTYFQSKNSLPLPDLVAVNGPVAKNTYIEGGYSEQHIIEVEALRYLYLFSEFPPLFTDDSKGSFLKVLVCGDFLSSTNHKLLSWLAVASQSMPQGTSYVIKPHPAYPVEFKYLNLLSIDVTTAPLSELFKTCNVVFTSNITSASVDAYCSGIPVIQMLDGQIFNVSPLRNIKGVKYVRSPEELTEALLCACKQEHFKAEPYFNLDINLPRWLSLLYF
jgi:surface carbohydrate biosynthesis protein (TIGR04326 family)